jgi:hypothetical protein
MNMGAGGTAVFTVFISHINISIALSRPAVRMSHTVARDFVSNHGKKFRRM